MSTAVHNRSDKPRHVVAETSPNQSRFVALVDRPVVRRPPLPT
jgi:hypothetical protein